VTVHHAALETAPADREPLAAFFALLGFERVEPPEALRDRALWLERQGTQIHVLFADAPVVPRQGHVAVVAPDYDAAMERLEAAGFEPEQRTRYWPAHNPAPRCFVRAPGGHRVEVMAAPPGAGA
jgi:catechol 2,3-dioxygenase-like lactoylglutathione lyase family enzyme